MLDVVCTLSIAVILSCWETRFVCDRYNYYLKMKTLQKPVHNQSNIIDVIAADDVVENVACLLTDCLIFTSLGLVTVKWSVMIHPAPHGVNTSKTSCLLHLRNTSLSIFTKLSIFPLQKILSFVVLFNFYPTIHAKITLTLVLDVGWFLFTLFYFSWAHVTLFFFFHWRCYS